jgi:ribonuclease HI
MEEKLGFGLHITGEIELDHCGSIRDEGTVFMAELTAIKKAAEIIYDYNPIEKVISFKTDSMSSIMALTSHIFKSLLAYETRLALDQLGKDNIVNIEWVKAHVGEYGNEIADELAKNGRDSDEIYREDINVPQSHRKKVIKEKALQIWNKRWHKSQKREQTKHWMESVDIKKSEQILLLPRHKVAKLTHFITGFNFLGRHVHKEHNTISQFCRACEDHEVEDAIHLIRDCPQFISQSRLIMNKYHENESWTVKNLIEFLCLPGIDNLLSDRRA